MSLAVYLEEHDHWERVPLAGIIALAGLTVLILGNSLAGRVLYEIVPKPPLLVIAIWLSSQQISTADRAEIQTEFWK